MMDKDLFLKATVPETVVALPDGGTVRVRGLTRAEVVGLQAHKDDLGALERHIIQLGLVDPQLTTDEVDGWYGHAPSGHIDLLTSEISRLSGLTEGATKSGVSGVRGKRGS